MFTKEDSLLFDRILDARWTCRSFEDTVPDQADIEAVIHAGIIAPFPFICEKDVTPFRHFFVMKKGDPRLAVIDRLIKEQAALDLAALREEAKTDPFMKENSAKVDKLYSGVVQNGATVFPDPPCMIVLAEWRGARRAERQSLAHMVQNMWLKATVLNLDFNLISFIESMVDNQEFCDLFGLPVGRYGFHGVVLGYHRGSPRNADPATSEVHW